MLYELHTVFNLFFYISFRAAGAMVTSLLLAFLVGPVVIRRLARGNIGEVIRAEGPATHHAKRGTPTMGGLIILLATLVPTVLWARIDNRFVWVAVGATLWMGAIGFVDDYLKVVEGKSKGLVARHKLVGQVTFGVALGLYLLWQPLVTTIPATATTLPFLKFTIVLMIPAVYVAFVTFIVTGWSNAVNLTDGLDGLAAGLSAIAAATFAVFAYLYGRVDISGYLNIYYLPGAGELAIFCTSLMGACLGFLWFNSHPAQVFMGDTGSMALGGAFGAIAILLKSEFLLLLIGAVFVAETASVMLQTSVFKYRKKRFGAEYASQNRVFRMAPLHHHFEKLGWPESKVVFRFYILGILAAFVALSTLKIR